MKTQMAYCSACDREVRVLVTDAPEQEGQATLPDAEVVCLEIGVQCTGSMCPVGALSPTAMKVRRVRVGIRDVLQPMVEAECEVCGRVTAHYLVDASYATCGECGTTIDQQRLIPATGRDD